MPLQIQPYNKSIKMRHSSQHQYNFFAIRYSLSKIMDGSSDDRDLCQPPVTWISLICFSLACSISYYYQRQRKLLR